MVLSHTGPAGKLPPPMIDPLLRLAFSMHSAKGVHALLLGSGVSRSAGIPTGWEIVLDLARSLATLHGEDTAGDPERWYRSRFGHPPEYSELLNSLAQTPTERQQLLQGYFEPTAGEREEGLKVPQPAHRAIGRLVARGSFKVIITTNFDRLIEQALQDEGVTPVTISSPDQAEGAPPLVHAQCTLIKVHGDYLDTRRLV